MPSLKKLDSIYKSQGLVIVGFSNEGFVLQSDTLRKRCPGVGLMSSATWKFVQDLNNIVYGKYAQNNYIPLNYVIRRDGKVDFWSEGYNATGTVASIERCLAVLSVRDGAPQKLKAETASLAQNRPNQITFRVADAKSATLSFYNGQGRLVQTIVKDNLDSSTRNIMLCGLENGVYLCRFTSGSENASCRVVVAK